MKKLLLTLCGLGLACSAYAKPYMTVLCNMDPAANVPAAVSDGAGKMKAAPSCGAALASIPVDYSLVNVTSQATKTQAFVSYLFTLQS
jgi:hypothetical protein